jgi:hypothetical protein
VLLAVAARTPAALVMWLALPLALGPWRTVMRSTGAALNAALAQTARLHAVSGVLLAAALWASPSPSPSPSPLTSASTSTSTSTGDRI